MMLPPQTQAPAHVNQMRVVQGGQQESRPQMVGSPVGVAGSPMGPGFQVQYSPGPPQQWGPGQPLGGGGMDQPMMSAEVWHAQGEWHAQGKHTRGDEMSRWRWLT